MLTDRILKFGLFAAFVCLCFVNSGFGIDFRKKDKPEPQDSKPAELNPAVLDKIDAVVEQAISNRVTPGAVVIIGTPEKTYLARAYGKLTYDADATSMTLDTLFDLASVTKVVATATATMRLIQDGKLALNDSVSKYIPGFAQPDKNKITIHHLLTHTSGLPAYASIEAVKKAADPSLPPYENLIRFISNMKLKYETGKDYTYSCLNYLTLAYINKTVLGYTQDKFLKETVYGPLGMTDTTYYVTAEQRRRTAPTIKNEKEFRQGDVHDPLAYYSVSPEYAPGNAGLFSTAIDLEKYCRMILNCGKSEKKEIFNCSILQLMTMNAIPAEIKAIRGLGWDIFEKYPWGTPINATPTLEVIGHTGYTGTLIRIDKYARNYLILLTNRVYPDDKADVKSLRESVMKILIESCSLYETLAVSQ